MQTVLSDSEIRFLEQLTAHRRLNGREKDELTKINCQENPIPGLPSCILTSSSDGMAALCCYIRESEDDSVPLLSCSNGDATFWSSAGLISRVCRQAFPQETAGKTVFVEVLQAGVQLPRLIGAALKKLLNLDVSVVSAAYVGHAWVLDPEEKEGLAARALALGIRCGAAFKLRAFGCIDQQIDSAVEVLRAGLSLE